MKITLDARETHKLENALEVLQEYSRIFSEMVKGKQGTFFDTAATAAGLLETIIHENGTPTQTEK